MPDYMYLLESRLSPEQRAVLERVQELSRSQDLNIYLTGGAVRDLISGMPIRDLDFTVEGNPLRRRCGWVYLRRTRGCVRTAGCQARGPIFERDGRS